MAYYSKKIRETYKNKSITKDDYKLIDSGNGVEIREWNEAKLGARPDIQNIDSQITDKEIENLIMAVPARMEADMAEMATRQAVNSAVDAISSMAEAKVFIKKMANILYTHIKESVD